MSGESEYLRRPDAAGHLKVLECLRKWDPIGVFEIDLNWPKDEYDGYSATIVRLLDAGMSTEDLIKHLREIVEQNMGSTCNVEKTSAIAHELVEFWKKWKNVEPSG